MNNSTAAGFHTIELLHQIEQIHTQNEERLGKMKEELKGNEDEKEDLIQKIEDIRKKLESWNLKGNENETHFITKTMHNQRQKLKQSKRSEMNDFVASTSSKNEKMTNKINQISNKIRNDACNDACNDECNDECNDKWINRANRGNTKHVLHELELINDRMSNNELHNKNDSNEWQHLTFDKNELNNKIKAWNGDINSKRIVYRTQSQSEIKELKQIENKYYKIKESQNDINKNINDYYHRIANSNQWHESKQGQFKKAMERVKRSKKEKANCQEMVLAWDQINSQFQKKQEIVTHKKRDIKQCKRTCSQIRQQIHH